MVPYINLTLFCSNKNKILLSELPIIIKSSIKPYVKGRVFTGAPAMGKF